MPTWDIQTVATWAGLLGVSVIGILTPAVRALRGRRRRVELEEYLRTRKANHPNSYQHTVEHLALNTSLTPDQIENAARRSKRINRIPRKDRNGMALGYLLEWKG